MNDAAITGPGFLIAYKGRQWRVPVARTRQLVQGVRIHRMPGKHPFVRGVASIRGEILPVLDWTGFLAAEASDDRDARPLYGEQGGEDLLVLEDSRCQRLALSIEGDPVQAICTDADLSLLADLEQRLRAGAAQEPRDGVGAGTRGVGSGASKRQPLGERNRDELILKAGKQSVVIALETLIGFSDGRHLAPSPAHLPGLHSLTAFRNRAYPVFRLANLLEGERSSAESAGSLLAYVSLGEVALALLVDDIEVVPQDQPGALATARLHFSQIELPGWLDGIRTNARADSAPSAPAAIPGARALVESARLRAESVLRGRAFEFEVGPSGSRLRCAVEIASVLRIMRARRMARLPTNAAAQAKTLALIEDRGGVLPCIDGRVLCERVDVAARVPVKGGYDLVLMGPHGEFALRVERVIGLTSYAEIHANASANGTQEGLRVVNRDGQVRVLLSTSGISSIAEAALA